MIDNLRYYKDKYDIQKFDWGEVVWLHEPTNLLTQRLSVGLVKFFPDKKQLRHVHFGEEQILYVLQGQGMHKINGEEEKIKEGMLIHCPPYSEHEVINIGSEDLTFLIIYTPSKLVELQKNIPIVNSKYILDLVEKEVLENIQKEISELLKLSVVIIDKDNNYITEPINLNKFCDLCKRADICKEKNKKFEGSVKELDKVFECCNNIITIMSPILLGDEIIGYVKCGYVLINKPMGIEEFISNNCNSDIINSSELIAAYNDVPLIPKSRLYALQESLGIVSKVISQIIENNLVEQELSEKNNELLKNAKQKIYLEDALKQANKKLLRSQLVLGLQNHSFKPENTFNRVKIEYPLKQEDKIKDAIKKLDENLSEQVILETIAIYDEKEFSIYDVKEIFEELLVTLCRVVYEKTSDNKMFFDLRYKYKEKLKGCNNYNVLHETLMEFSKESINILRHILLSGKHDLIQKINLYIESNFQHDITLNFLAGMFFISPNYLSTIFNEKNCMSLKDYINKLRIKKGKKYLLETDMKISDISKTVGYAQSSYFCSIFKKLENCTPNEFRVQLKRENIT